MRSGITQQKVRKGDKKYWVISGALCHDDEQTHNNGLDFFSIFDNVVGNNVLDQSLEGLEKIGFAGCDIRTAMNFLHVTHGRWRWFLKQTRVFSRTKQETFPLYIATMDERVKSAAASLRADRSGNMTSSLAMQFAENAIFMRAVRASLQSLSRRRS
eukprot:scaffold221219_cov52-Attheya_sp.AAC.1